jgi:hypothetical protein
MNGFNNFVDTHKVEETHLGDSILTVHVCFSLHNNKIHCQ